MIVRGGGAVSLAECQSLLAFYIGIVATECNGIKGLVKARR